MNLNVISGCKFLTNSIRIFYSNMHKDTIFRLLSSSTNLEPLKREESNSVSVSWKTEDDVMVDLKNSNSGKECQEEDKMLITEPCNEDLTLVAPYIQPTFNFAAYINKSPTLQELVKLGVNLHKVEKRRNGLELILKLDFEKVKEYIRFLHDKGIPLDEIGAYFTKNPYIFEENLENLQVRINYLESKKFSTGMIERIISKNPYWLLFRTEKIDERLGYFQTTFNLVGNEVRELATKQPRLITYSLQHIKVNNFTVKEEMGFSDKEMKALLLKKPRLWIKSNKVLTATFDYVHNVMKLPHDRILDFPEILCSRIDRIKQRHLFLESLGRAQYDPTLEGYVSPKALVSSSDTEFCLTVAKSSVESFNIFLKSI